MSLTDWDSADVDVFEDGEGNVALYIGTCDVCGDGIAIPPEEAYKLGMRLTSLAVVMMNGIPA